MFVVFEEVRVIKQRTKFNFNGKSGCVWVFMMEFLYGILSMFKLRCLFPFTFLTGISMPVYKIFEFSTMFSGVYDLFNLVFFFLFDDSWRRGFRLFLGRESALVIGCQ